MTTTNLDIIKGAMRKLHVLPGGSEPTSSQSAACMTGLQDLLVELIGQGSLGRLFDVLATANYTAYEWDRIRASAAVVVTLPTTITQERSDCGEGDYGFSSVSEYASCEARPPRNLAPVVVINSSGVETVSIYNAYKGAWVTITGLATTDDFPFPSHFDNGFKALLAERMADDFGMPVGTETAKQANQCRLMLSAKRDNPRRTGQVEYS